MIIYIYTILYQNVPLYPILSPNAAAEILDFSRCHGLG